MNLPPVTTPPGSLRAAHHRAYELGQSDPSYAVAALTAYTAEGARQSMVRMAMTILAVPTVDHDIVDVLADSYWSGIRNADTRRPALAKTPTVVLNYCVDHWVRNG